jgi:hypothetical protein
MHPLAIHPLRPGRGVARELLGRQDPVPGRVLHIDVQGGAAHVQDNVNVDVERVRDTLLDGKGVLLGAAPPARELGPEEDQRDERDGDSPLAAARGAGYVLRFGFCCGVGGGMLVWGGRGLLEGTTHTEGVKCADEVAWFCAKGVFVELALLIAVHHGGDVARAALCRRAL